MAGAGGAAPRTRNRRATTWSLLLALALGPIATTGCSLFRDERGGNPEVTAPEPAERDASPRSSRRTADRAPATKPAAKVGAASRPTPADTLAALPPAPAPPLEAPQVTVQLTAEQRSVREMAYRDDTSRAARALDGVRTRVLTSAQRDQLGSADRFLADAIVAFEANDLVRACSLAQKARVLAEELKAAVAP